MPTRSKVRPSLPVFRLDGWSSGTGNSPSFSHLMFERHLEIVADQIVDILKSHKIDTETKQRDLLVLVEKRLKSVTR